MKHFKVVDDMQQYPKEAKAHWQAMFPKSMSLLPVSFNCLDLIVFCYGYTQLQPKVQKIRLIISKITCII